MLNVDHISFSYDDNLVLEDISLKVSKGEHVSIIGESGCGKSTLLKIIYGLLQVDKGEVFWDETKILGPNYNLVPGEPYMKYLSQDFDLMPFTSVEENIGQFLSVFEPEHLKERTSELLEMIEMTKFAKVKVKYLSGGQQQRVALARVLAQRPKVLLLDEPFSHIDNFRKNSLRRNLFGFLKEKDVTVITATHDHNDMLPFADTVVVLKDHKIIAKDTPKNLYEHPKDLYIAALFSEANKIPINIVKTYADTKRRIIVYAHEFRVSEKSGLEVEVKRSFYKGGYYMIQGIYEGQKIHFNHSIALEPELKVFLNVSIETINQRLNQNPNG
ncbi:ABC transporter ATP-binding protein [Maribacter sp. HTCC2170]|uniref:ABC transporter ATP-binding protein n=1 Tax=Maribacter sp. (strain HTCC2170 / KCCM 42371) TaxID=313603 RepID=UPI00006BD2B4|nr:ABC transporter ATP-binding protein [Maribacter sp. HTCC2170]EAR02880.1 iron(III) ABC transporter ATP-binding protein [Maribacter sp. HTCC2170]